MKKKYLFLLLPVLIAVCLWRYHDINAYYEKLFPSNPVQSYSISEVVPIEEDFINYGSGAEGYSIRADDFEIITTEEAREKWPASEGVDLSPAEKIVIVYITLLNESGDSGIMLTDLAMHSKDVPLFMNWNLLTAANPILEGNYGIILPQGMNCELVLPFSLNSSYFSKKTWNEIDAQTFYLQITSYPTIKEISLVKK